MWVMLVVTSTTRATIAVIVLSVDYDGFYLSNPFRSFCYFEIFFLFLNFV